MAQCEVCSNDYDKTFEVVSGGKHHVFDSFECAIQALAPTCSHCHCRIIGHGIEADFDFFCCANCARRAGKNEAHDRVGEGAERAVEAEIVSRDYVLRGTP